MSRFIDKLMQLSKTESQPMGFKREKVYSKPRLMLVVECGADASKVVLKGTDAVILTDMVKDLPEKLDIPVGIRLRGARIDKFPEGIDFIVFQFESPVVIAGGKKKGKVIALEASTDLDLIRSLDDLPFDALFISQGGGEVQESINWRYLILCRRIASLSKKPLLVTVGPQINKHELQLLWEIGVDGLVVTHFTAGNLKKLRSLIDQLIIPSNRKRQEIRAIIPKLGVESTSVADIDDDEV